VNDPATLIPFKPSAKTDAITLTDRHAFGEIDIVRHHNSMSVPDIEDKSLVTRPFIVIRKNALNPAFRFQPDTRTPGGVCRLYHFTRGPRAFGRWQLDISRVEILENDQADDGQQR
jgi:hypothetical protein